jgi:arylsulfatase A-like enzyme
MKADKSWDRNLYQKNSSEIVSHADILPTIIKATGAKVPDDVDGIDLCESLEHKLPTRKYIDMISGAGVESPLASIAITDGKWKYIWYPEGGNEQLFDLENDRYETKNLAGEKSRQDILEELKDELIKRHENLAYGFVKNDKLVKTAVKNDQIDGKWKLYPWAPGYTTEYCEHDIKH